MKVNDVLIEDAPTWDGIMKAARKPRCDRHRERRTRCIVDTVTFWQPNKRGKGPFKGSDRGLVSDECLNSIILHNIHYVTTRRWRLSYCFHRNWPDFLGASQDVMIYFYQNAADANRNNAFFLLFGIDPTFGIPESRDVTIVTLWIF